MLRGAIRGAFLDKCETLPMNAYVQFHFPDSDMTRDWFQSPEYAELRDVRTEAMSLTLLEVG